MRVAGSKGGVVSRTVCSTLCVLMVSFALCFTGAAMSADELEYDLDIPQLSLDEALKALARQVDVQLLFPFDLVRTLNANPVKGRYTLAQALAILLEGTGLAGDLTGSGVITISRVTSVSAPEARVGEVVNTNKKAGLGAMLAAAFSVGAGAQDVDTLTEAEIEMSIVMGKVTDARTGANLRGAKVTIEETGQWASTNDLGEFRLVNVPTGSATLTVSFLGYAGQSTVVGVRGDSVSQDFALRGGDEIEEIVVFGQRSARAIALNQERTASNFQTVIASDFLGQFNGTTISDALRVAPGVAFELNPETGEGDNISVRGLPSGFNQVTLNGVRVNNDFGFRESNLSNILTESVESVTINKTLLPSQDGTGTGALVEIETKSPLDRGRRFAQFTAEHTERGDEFGTERLYGGTISGTFGARSDFGASLSAQFRTIDIKRLGHAPNLAYGQYLPSGISNISQINDPTLAFPFEPGISEAYPLLVRNSSADFDSENLSVTASFEKQFGRHTNWRLDYTASRVTTTSLTRDLTVDPSETYRSTPIAELGGEERFALITQRPSDASVAPDELLISVGQLVSYRPDREADTDTISFHGDTSMRQWSFDYGVGYSKLDTVTETFDFGIQLLNDLNLRSIRETDVDPSVWNNRVNDRIISIFNPILPGRDPGFIAPAFTQSFYDRINDPANFRLSGSRLFGNLINTAKILNDNERLSGELSARFTSKNDWLDYIEFGFFTEDYSLANRPATDTRVRYTTLDGLSVADIGLDFGGGILSAAGLGTNGFDIVTEGSVAALQRNVESLSTSGLLARQEFSINPSELDAETIEAELAAYIEFKLDWKNLELIGGFRYVDVTVDSRFFSQPTIISAAGIPLFELQDELAGILETSASQSDILPRFLLNYRYSDNLIFRGGYYTTVARPEALALSERQRVDLILLPFFGPTFNQPLLSVSQGNPDLRPSYADNYDASVEWYSDDIGVIKFSAFYNKIKDPFTNLAREAGLELLPEDLTLPNDPIFTNLPDNIFVQVSQPSNSDNDVTTWGAELSIERNFVDLSGIYSGLGILGSLTYADSEQIEQFNVTTDEGDLVEIKTRVPGAPKWAGVAAITYNNFGIDSSLAYTWQGRSLVKVDEFGLDEFESEYDRLDFRAAYNGEWRGHRFTIYFKGNDLLRGSGDPGVVTEFGGERGAPVYKNIDSRYFGGRSFALGGSFTF